MYRAMNPGRVLSEIPCFFANCTIDLTCHRLRASDQGGHATQQRDTSRSKEKAKAENPKAPGPIIGMEDERGGKGLQ